MALMIFDTLNDQSTKMKKMPTFQNTKRHWPWIVFGSVTQNINLEILEDAYKFEPSIAGITFFIPG